MDKAVAILFLLWSTLAFGQFDPAGGEEGSFGIPSNSPFIVSWGDSIQVERGWQDASDTTLGKANQGFPSEALGASDNGAVSLGDGGAATYYLATPISDHQGFDFCVFENGFAWPGGHFLELAHVEVSSDGIHFVRFPSTSLAPTDVQFDNNAGMKSEWYHNLAGKHQAGYGTPFDLDELKDSTKIDISSITHIRIIDVVGSLDSNYGTYDSEGNIINDPWPTGFESSGFDLEALGILKENTLDVPFVARSSWNLPNPLHRGQIIEIPIGTDYAYLTTTEGRIVDRCENSINITMPVLPGYYYLTMHSKTLGTQTRKICVLP
jgi:hypothetical protein